MASDDEEGEGCWKLQLKHGWDAVMNRYTLRCYTAKVRMLCKTPPWSFDGLMQIAISRYLYKAEEASAGEIEEATKAEGPQ